MSLSEKDKEQIETWIAMLRSGKYKQDKNALKTRVDSTVSYCCLGVACTQFTSIRASEEVGFPSLLPETVKAKLPKWLFAVNRAPQKAGFKQSLAVLNDEGFFSEDTEEYYAPMTFDEIADVVQLLLIEEAMGPAEEIL